MNFKPETDHALFESLRTLRNQREDGTMAHSAYENEVTKLLAQRIYNASPPPPALYPHSRETTPPKVYFCWDSNVHRIKALTFPGNLPHGTRMLFQCKNSLEALHLCRPGMLDSLLSAHCTFPPFSPVMDVLPRARPIERPSFGTCNSCGKPAGLLCSKCKIVCYCSFACQKKDWSEHKLKCDCLLRGKRLDELIAADSPAAAAATVSDELNVVAAPEVLAPAKKYVHGYRLLQSSSGSFVHVVYCEREGMQHALNEYAKLLLEPVVQQNSSKTGSTTKQASCRSSNIQLVLTRIVFSRLGLSCAAHTTFPASRLVLRRCDASALSLFFSSHAKEQKFCEGVAEILSMPYYNLTAHEMNPSVVSALLNMAGVPASAVALYLIQSFLQQSQQVVVKSVPLL
jgi:hypothetical protein